MASTVGRERWPTVGTGREGVAGTRAGQCRTTFTPAMALSVSRRWRLSRSKSGDSGPTSFCSTASAPARSAAMDVWMSRSTSVDTTTTGVGTSVMMRLVASSPSMFGIWMSMVTRCGRRRWVSSTASRPSLASPTTCRVGSSRMISTRSRRAVGESSATTTRKGLGRLAFIAVASGSPAGSSDQTRSSPGRRWRPPGGRAPCPRAWPAR